MPPPLSQLLQYNKQDRTAFRCAFAQAEPRRQYIQLDYMINKCNAQIKQKISLSTLFRRWKKRQPSRNPYRSLSLFLVPQPCRF